MSAKTIVVADDRAQKLQPIAASLREAGFNVVNTRDVTRVTELAAQGSADLLITNYCLDDSSGVELCQGLRRDKRSALVPAILVTALGYCVGEKAAAMAGIRRIVPETRRASDIVASVNDVLNHRRAA